MPNVMVGEPNHPVTTILPLASVVIPSPLSSYVPPADFAQSTLPLGSYLTTKISAPTVPPLFVRVVVPNVMVGE